MTARTRTRYTSEPKGMRYRFGTSAGGFDVFTDKSSVVDFTGHGDCAPFNTDSVSVVGGKVNQPYTGFFASAFDNYRVDFLDNPNTFNHMEFNFFGGSEFPNDVDIATRTAARTNPSRPYVDVAANVLELGGITNDIFSLGGKTIQRLADYKNYIARFGFKQALRDIGDINLLYQFGLAPLVGDIVKISAFQSAFNRRCNEIQKLRGPHGFRKTVDIGTWQEQTTYNEVFQSQDKYISGPCVVTATENVRCHVRWITDEDPSNLMADEDMAKLVRKAMVNFNPVDAISLWEAIPWSWLIDWGSNIGDYFKATRNIIPAYLDGVHVMRHAKTEWYSGPVRDQNYEMSPFRATYETKSRKPSFVFPVAHFPFLTGNQMGIVASLAVTRMK